MHYINKTSTDKNKLRETGKTTYGKLACPTLPTKQYNNSAPAGGRENARGSFANDVRTRIQRDGGRG